MVNAATCLTKRWTLLFLPIDGEEKQNGGSLVEYSRIKIKTHLLGQAPEGWMATPSPRLRVAQKPTRPLGSFEHCSDDFIVVLP
jgi:hypothetical protein